MTQRIPLCRAGSIICRNRFLTLPAESESLPSVRFTALLTVSRFDKSAGWEQFSFPGVNGVKQPFPGHPEHEFPVPFQGAGRQ